MYLNPVTATAPSSMVKNTYGFIQSSKIIDMFQERGWHVTQTSALNVKEGSPKNGFQRHLVRLENDSLPMIEGLSGNNASKVQLCFMNSHDGTTAYRMFLGALRMACLNGVIAGNSIAHYRVVHSERALKGLHEGLEAMVANIPTFIDQIATMQETQVTPERAAAYVKAIFDARVMPIGRVTGIGYNLPLLREEDRANDAYTLFNRVQEKLIRGGIEYRVERSIYNGAGEEVGTYDAFATTRKVSSISKQLHLNQLAYEKAMEILVAA